MTITTSPRPLQDVLDEHLDELAAQRASAARFATMERRLEQAAKRLNRALTDAHRRRHDPTAAVSARTVGKLAHDVLNDLAAVRAQLELEQTTTTEETR